MTVLDAAASKHGATNEIAEPTGMAERDSGDEEYLSHEEHEREVAPSGLTRLNADNI